MSIHVDAYYKSLNKKNEELCGDKVEIIRTDRSIILVLADGLGSGVKANILATLTSKIIGTMLKNGAELEEVVETIVNTLPVCKVRKLAYSTFSILEIDNERHAHLVEFDSPSCVFIRDGELQELPIEEKEIWGKQVRECRFDVLPGDVFAIFSDGVIHAGVGQTLNLGWEWQNAASFLQAEATPEMSASRICASLSSVCDNLYMGQPGDDTTVLVAKVLSHKIVNFFSGPPKSQEMDQKLVHDFLENPEAKRVVCGGTSANIVSRITGKQIATSLEYVDPDVPPIAYIEGIDLVTEGVLTISKTVEILKEYMRNDIDYDYLKSLDQKNGAALLAKLLIEDCTTLHLFVGKAINPAHQNPNLPVDLSIKLRLLEELAHIMEALGKRVTVTYY